MSTVDLRALRSLVKQGRMTLEEFLQARAKLQAKSGGLVTKAAIALPRKSANTQLVGRAQRRARALEARVDVADHDARVRIAEIAQAEARRLRKQNR